MRRILPASLPVWVACVIFATGACSDATGLHVFVHRGGTSPEELRFAVLLDAAPDGSRPAESIVNPDGAGRRLGPFSGDPVDVIVYLPDESARRTARCTVTAMIAGAAAATAENAAIVTKHELARVDLYLGAGTGGTGGTAGSPAAGTGAGGTSGTPGANGSGNSGSGNGSSDVPDPDTACAGLPAGAVCEPGRCDKDGKKATPARACDQNGRCMKSEPVDCGDEQRCSEGVCQPRAEDDDPGDD